MEEAQKIRMQYLGVLSLLCEAAPYVPEDDSAGALIDRELIERALDDACEVIPSLSYRRLLNRYELNLMVQTEALGAE